MVAVRAMADSAGLPTVLVTGAGGRTGKLQLFFCTLFYVMVVFLPSCFLVRISCFLMLSSLSLMGLGVWDG